MAELLKEIPPEKRWAITAKILTRFMMRRGTKTIPPLLSKGEGIFAPVMGWEKWQEIADKAWGVEGGKSVLPWVKETFNIPVEDAAGAAKLVKVATTLQQGPEFTTELVEATPEKAVLRVIKCVWWERYKELEVDPEHRICGPTCQAWVGEGLKAISPKLTFKHTKAMPRGDPHCDGVYEFKEE